MCQLWEIVTAWQLIYLHCQYYKLLEYPLSKRLLLKSYTYTLRIAVQLTHVFDAFEYPYTKLKDMIFFFCNIV